MIFIRNIERSAQMPMIFFFFTVL